MSFFGAVCLWLTVSPLRRWSERQGTSAFWWTMPELWQGRNSWTRQIRWSKRRSRSTRWRISGSVTAEPTAFCLDGVLTSALKFIIFFWFCWNCVQFFSSVLLFHISHFLFQKLCFLLCLIQTYKAFLPAMIANNHGHLVSIASTAGLIGVNGLAGVVTCYRYPPEKISLLTLSRPSSEQGPLFQLVLCFFWFNKSLVLRHVGQKSSQWV